jgi:hypothetical protein
VGVVVGIGVEVGTGVGVLVDVGVKVGVELGVTARVLVGITGVAVKERGDGFALWQATINVAAINTRILI